MEAQFWGGNPATFLFNRGTGNGTGLRVWLQDRFRCHSFYPCPAGHAVVPNRGLPIANQGIFSRLRLRSKPVLRRVARNLQVHQQKGITSKRRNIPESPNAPSEQREAVMRVSHHTRHRLFTVETWPGCAGPILDGSDDDFSEMVVPEAPGVTKVTLGEWCLGIS